MEYNSYKKLASRRGNVTLNVSYDFCHRKPCLFFLESDGESIFFDFPFGEDFVFGKCMLSLGELLLGELLMDGDTQYAVVVDKKLTEACIQMHINVTSQSCALGYTIYMVPTLSLLLFAWAQADLG